MKWVMVITLLIVSNDVFSQVRGTTWGDSWEQVEETINDLEFENIMAEVFGLDTYEFKDRLILRNTAQLTNGDTTAVRYFLLDDKLSSINVEFISQEISIGQFNEIADLLKRKYGSPQEDRINDDPTKAIENWNKALDEALQKGEMLIERIWEDDETYVRLEMGHYEDGPMMQIIYFSQLFYDEFIKEMDRGILNDF